MVRVYDIVFFATRGRCKAPLRHKRWHPRASARAAGTSARRGSRGSPARPHSGAQAPPGPGRAPVIGARAAAVRGVEAVGRAQQQQQARVGARVLGRQRRAHRVRAARPRVLAQPPPAHHPASRQHREGAAPELPCRLKPRPQAACKQRLGHAHIPASMPGQTCPDGLKRRRAAWRRSADRTQCSGQRACRAQPRAGRAPQIARVLRKQARGAALQVPGLAAEALEQRARARLHGRRVGLGALAVQPLQRQERLCGRRHVWDGALPAATKSGCAH